MLNREKYAKEILNIACEGHSIAMIDGKLRQCSGASCSKCDFNSNINCRKILTNGRTVNMSNHRLIGARFQSIHRFWSEILNFLRGAKNILQNMKMKRFIHGITEKRHGAHMTVK